MVKSKVSAEWINERKAALPAELKALICKHPGKTKTHYLYLKVEQGGVRGLSDDKYEALSELMQRGEIVEGYNSGKRKEYKGLYPAGHPDIDKPTGDFEMEEALLGLVARHEGKGKAFYCRLSPSEGGLLGSQERKERALAKLVQDGKVRCAQLDKAVGRKKQEYYVA